METPGEEDREKRKQVRLFGRISVEDVAEAAIQSGDILPRLDNMDIVSLEKLTQSAVDHENLPALVTLAKINKYAVSNTLKLENMVSLGRIAGRGGLLTPKLYFVTRGVMDERRRAIFRRFARTSLLKLSLRIAGQGLRGDVPKMGEYAPYMDFDLDETMEQVLEKYPEGIPLLTPRDIVGIERRERQKNGVLILDTSGSMMGERNTTAALAAAVMAYSMRRDKFGVVAFNTKGFHIKSIDEEVKIEDIVDRILDLEAVGYTNIEDALVKGVTQLRSLKTRFKWAVLLTDGAYNKGSDPRKVMGPGFGKLHVINLPGKVWGKKVCQDLARLGGGRYVSVASYKEVPRALMRILRSPW